MIFVFGACWLVLVGAWLVLVGVSIALLVLGDIFIFR